MSLANKKNIAIQILLGVLTLFLCDRVLNYCLQHDLLKPHSIWTRENFQTGKREVHSSFKSFETHTCKDDLVIPDVDTYDWHTEETCKKSLANGLTAFLPNSSCDVVFENKAIGKSYRAKMSFDESGRRNVPWGKKETGHAILMGCSLTLGIGLNDNETLAAQVGDHTNKQRPYLLAYTGASPSDIYVNIDDLLKGIPNTPGVAIYLAVADQVRRFAGTASVLAWSENHAAVSEEPQGTFKVLGSWRVARPRYTRLIQILGESGFIRFLGIDLPLINDAKIASYARLINAIKAKYMHNFPNGHFYYAFRQSASRQFYSALKRNFDLLGIDYIDYSDICTTALLGIEPSTLLGNGHSSREFNREFAKIIVKDFNLQ